MEQKGMSGSNLDSHFAIARGNQYEKRMSRNSGRCSSKDQFFVGVRIEFGEQLK